MGLSLRLQEELKKTRLIRSVELVASGYHRMELHASEPLPTGSKVRIQCGRKSAEGVVKKCQAEHMGFRLSVQVLKGKDWLLKLPPCTNHFDPGLLSVENFISDEQFLQLLNEMEVNVRHA
jgi:hypothetical protein